MRRVIFTALVGITLVGCSGSQNFAKKKHGHLHWIKTGGEVMQPQKYEEVAEVDKKQKQFIAEDFKLNKKEASLTDSKKEVETKVLPVSEKEKSTSENKNEVKTVSVEDVKGGNAETPSEPKTEIRQEQEKQSQGKPLMDSDVKFIVALILCFLIPPISVYMYRGKDGLFVLDLVLFLLWFLLFLGPWGLFGLASIVLALLVVLELI